MMIVPTELNVGAQDVNGIKARKIVDVMASEDQPKVTTSPDLIVTMNGMREQEMVPEVAREGQVVYSRQLERQVLTANLGVIKRKYIL